MSEKHIPEFVKAMATLTNTNVFFTVLMYNMKIEARDDLPFVAGTDAVHLYYNPKRFVSELIPQLRVFAIVHELVHVILFHNTRRGIRDPKRWNIACDHADNLLCVEYGFVTFEQIKKNNWYADPQYKGMTAEKIYDLLPEDCGESDMDVMDYDPSQNENQTKLDVERAVAIATEQAAQAARASGQDTAAMKRLIGEAQVEREPWYQHLRRYMTSMNSRQYNWARIDSRRAVLHNVVSPQMRSEQMGKVVFWVDCSGSITAKQLGAMGAHISDILKDVTPSAVVVGYFDSEVCHVDEFTGPDYNLVLEPHGGGGTCFAPMFEYMEEYQQDAQLAVVFTDLYGSFGPGNQVCDTLWVSQTEHVEVPFGELIYGDLNEG